MKYPVILLFLLLAVIFKGHGQSHKNDIKLTVAALPLFGSSEAFSSGINGLVIKPSVGYFISDKTSLDLNFSYACLNDLSVDGIDSFYRSYAFVPTLRNNFINKKTLRVFAEFGFGLGTIAYNADNKNLNTSTHRELSGGISILNIGLGCNYFLNDHFGLELIIPYLNTINITSQNSSNLYSGIGPTFGLTYML